MVKITEMEERVEASDGAEAGIGVNQKKSQGEFSLDGLSALAIEEFVFFHTPESEAVAMAEINDHQETYRVRSKKFIQMLRRHAYIQRGKVLSKGEIDKGLEELEAFALFETVEEELHTRLAMRDGRIYLDLANVRWEQVEISPDGWKVISASESPVRFERSTSTKPLPYPVQEDGALWKLKKYLNTGSDDAWWSVLFWLISAFRPSGPYPILVLQGEKGSAKSTSARLVQDLIHPGVPCSLPSNERGLAIAGSKNWVLSFDNVSAIPAWMSDALCRVSTRFSFRTRKLHTDDSEVKFEFARPVILNGIPDLTTRDDLADRCIVVSFSSISEDRRLSERKLLAAWEADKPSILGALLNAVSTALKNIDEVDLKATPRMADFAEWSVAAEPALGCEEGTFARIYQENQERLVDIALESDPLGHEVITFMSRQKEWKGSPAGLLDRLTEQAPERVRRSREWPKLPNQLSNRLHMLACSLKKRGISVERYHSGVRYIVLTCINNDSNESMKIPFDLNRAQLALTSKAYDTQMTSRVFNQAFSDNTSEPPMLYEEGAI